MMPVATVGAMCATFTVVLLTETIITMRKSIHGSPLLSYRGMGLRLPGCRSSAKITVKPALLVEYRIDIIVLLV